MSDILRTCNIIKDLTVKYLSMANKDDDLNSKTKSLKTLASVFSSYGGVLGKIAQTLSLENENSNVYDNAKPISSIQTHNYVSETLRNIDTFNNIDIEPSIYKNGSLGQVYKATDNEQKKLIIKVKYVNLDSETKSDLNIVETIIKYLYSTSNIKNALIDIKHKMLEELDYMNEVTNQIKIKELWDSKTDSNIEIPIVYNELSSSGVIVMEFMEDFISINDFLSNSTQEEKNIIGNLMFKFIFENLYEHNIYYADSHYGNFLVKDNNILCVLDFGCVTYYEDSMIDNLKNIHMKIFNEDKDGFIELMTRIGILSGEITDESKEYCYEFFKLQYEPLTEENFVFTDDWVDKAGEKNMVLMKEWDLPLGFIYLHKIPYGLYHILGKLKTKVNCGKILFEKYIN